MLADNRKILRDLSPVTYKKLSDFEEVSLQQSNIIIEPSRQGLNTLAVLKNEKPVYIHSKYDPKKEVATFIATLEDLSQTKHVFVIGLGLGYHLEEILKRYPHVKVTIFEPDLEILYAYVSNNKLAKNIKRIFHEIEDNLDIAETTKAFSIGTTTIIWPSYMRIYEQPIKKMQEKLVELLKGTQANIAANTRFQRRWVGNSILNYPQVLKTTNIITSKYEELFQDKPVILVAAGPSLAQDLPTLKKIREENSAYLFAVGTSVNALLKHEIIPHAVFSYDPTEVNQKVLQGVKDRNITNLPLVFGSSIGYESIIDYPSKMVHMTTSADYFSRKLLNIDKLQIIEDSPSIAVLALEVVKKLKMTPIILTGQNLGYLDNSLYAPGALVIDSSTSSQGKISIKDVEGAEMFTNDSYLRMKDSLERILKKHNTGKVFNATQKGAAIEGAPFKPLESIKQEWLIKKNIAIENWIIEEKEYSDGYTSFYAMLGSYISMMRDIDNSAKIADKIKRDNEMGIYSKIDKHIYEFNKVFKKVVDADAYKYLIGPANKVQKEKFDKNYKLVEFEKNPRKKAEKFMRIIYSYLGNAYEATRDFYPIMQKVNYILNEGEQ